MAAQKGRDLLIQMDVADNDTWVTIAGARDGSISINEENVDITNKDSSGIRQLMSGNIVRSLTVSGSGVFDNDAAFNVFRDSMMAGTHKEYKIVIPGTSTAGGFYKGFFRISSLEESGSYNGEVQYSFSLESADTTTWTDAT